MAGTSLYGAAQIGALHTTLKARFMAGLAQQNPDWQKVAGYIKSDNASNTYAWLTQFPAFREWVGNRQHKLVAENAYVVPNKKFEATLDVLRTDLEDDNFGHYGDIAMGYGQAVSDLKNTLIFSGLKNGISTACYDGQNFFSTAHPVYPNEDGTGTAVATSNYVTGTGEMWMLLCTKRAPKPFYLQERIAPMFEFAGDPNNSNTFELDKLSYGARWRGNIAYGFWQCAYGSKATLDANAFNAAYQAMQQIKRDGNRLLGMQPDLLVVGPANRVAALSIVNMQRLANGADNPNYQATELFVTPWLA